MPGDEAFESLLEYLRDHRAFDFTGYKRSTLRRRIARRMQEVGIDDVLAYRDHLQVHPGEFAHLFNTILINVTGFFRDPLDWEHLANEILPRLLDARTRAESIRVWSAGCASGEEAYTLAILLAEALGVEAFRQRVKIYATDVDEQDLALARQATYAAEALAALPEPLRERYFVPAAQGLTVRPELRRAVIFGRHDLVGDAPIHRVDLLTCRNTLMYFNAETQERIVARLHDALRADGYLFLGRVEMLLGHRDLFEPVDAKRRVFTKVPGRELRDRLLGALVDPERSGGGDEPPEGLTAAAFERGAVAEILVDVRGFLSMANSRARAAFGLEPGDVGRPFADLRVSYEPAELRSRIRAVATDLRPRTLPDVHWQPEGGAARYLDIELVPVAGSGGLLGVLVSFTDVTAARELQRDLDRANAELERTGEELQSSREELETINEELQSTNAELQSMNEELRSRTAEVEEVNAFLECIMAGVRGALVVLDRDLRVREWSRRAETLWGLRFEEASGERLSGLEIGLAVDELVPVAESVLAGAAPEQRITLPATTRAGQAVLCEVTVAPLLGKDGGTQGVILLMREPGR